jgi:hypothetical protein
MNSSPYSTPPITDALTRSLGLTVSRTPPYMAAKDESIAHHAADFGTKLITHGMPLLSCMPRYPPEAFLH